MCPYESHALSLSLSYRCYQGFICVVQISEISSRVARYNSGSVLNGRPLLTIQYIFFRGVMCEFKSMPKAMRNE